MKKILKKILPNNIYLILGQFYRFILGQKNIGGENLQSLRENEKTFQKLGFSNIAIKEILTQQGYSYEDGSLSWHYHIFAGWFDFCTRNRIKVKTILEIGTYNGKFTRFLSNVYKDAKIFTVDLPTNDKQFTSTYNRETLEKRNKFLSVRENNLQSSNITFIELNSINIAEFFKNVKFDAIWVDGDHHNPQVTIDLINSMSLLNKSGIMCNDDVIQDLKHEKDPYISNESFLTLDHLENNGLLENYYINKRIRNSVSKSQKYVSISKII